MLQTPVVHSSRSAFTKKQIVEMARGGKLVVRNKRKAKDPLVKLADQFRDAMADYAKASELCEMARKRLEDKGAGPLLYLDSSEAPGGRGGFFGSLASIDDAARRVRNVCNIEIKHYTKVVTSGKSMWPEEVKQQIAANKKRLASLPEDIRISKGLMRLHLDSVKREQAKLKYDDLLKAERQAYSRLWRTLRAINAGEVTSLAAARSLVEASHVILATKKISPDAAMPILHAVSAFLMTACLKDKASAK